MDYVTKLSSNTLPAGSTFYVHNTTATQTNTTINIDSGTIRFLNYTTLNPTPVVTGGATHYIQNSTAVQTNATLNIGSGTISYLNYSTLNPAIGAGASLYPATSTIIAPQSINVSSSIIIPAGRALITTVGTTIVSSITANGYQLRPTQPLFIMADLASPQPTNVTGDFTWYDYTTWGSERYDTSNSFTTNVFTAPITGKYILSATVILQGAGTAARYKYVQIAASNVTITNRIYDTNDAAGISLTAIVDMDINDTARVKVNCGPGSKDVDIGGGEGMSSFSGTLLQ